MENLSPTAQRYAKMYLMNPKRITDEGLQRAVSKGLVTLEEYQIIIRLNSGDE